MKLGKIKNINYRHYISIVITICFLLCSVFIFKNSFYRIVEAMRDIGLSIAYVFCEIFGIETSIQATVLALPSLGASLPSAPGGSSSGGVAIPDTQEGFNVLLKQFGYLFINKFNFIAYISLISKYLLVFLQALVILIPIVFVLKTLFEKYFNKPNNNYNKDSKPLIKFKELSEKYYNPVKMWLLSFFYFLRINNKYMYIWLAIWLYNFNLITILVEFFAFYIYFSFAFDFSAIYIQIYKLFLDLAPMFNFVPKTICIFVVVFALIKLRLLIAKKWLYHFENRNKGFINELPITTMAVGAMGKNKTTLIVDMALSQSEIQREKAKELLLKNDLKFPHFPWINFENEIKQSIEKGVIYNLASCKSFVKRERRRFELLRFNDNCSNYAIQKGYKYPMGCYDYDYNKYGLWYDNKLYKEHLFDVLETYCQLYFIYIIQSSLIVSNLSIRTDLLHYNLGNFPLWNGDFFSRDSSNLDELSTYAHILDFDILRLGKKVLENNRHAGSFEFGVVVITEVGKERGNMLETQGMKRNADEPNQKNDMLNYSFKMGRHPSTVDFYPFLKVFMDEQRPESLGKDARDLCDIIHIENGGSQGTTLPFFDIIDEPLHNWFYKHFSQAYYQYRYYRGDNTLFMYLYKLVVERVHRYYIRSINNYGFKQMKLKTESGIQDGIFKDKKYYLMNKKIYSNRFSTDCFNDYFNEKAKESRCGIIDYENYKTVKADFDELKKQNSYFINDLLNPDWRKVYDKTNK